MTVIANQEVFYHSDAKVEIWNVGANVAARTLVTQGSRFGVTLTNSPGQTGKDVIDIGPYEISQTKRVGVGNDSAPTIGANAAGVAVDGTWEFPSITGVTTSTAQGTPIYINAGVLTTTSSGGTLVGYVNYPSTYVRASGVAPVKLIGGN